MRPGYEDGQLVVAVGSDLPDFNTASGNAEL